MISKPTYDNVFEIKFSNSLTIHEEKRKETTTDIEKETSLNTIYRECRVI